ncbi:MAG: hypothetical protein V4651_01950, partial [Bacteroidota bacterium]
MYTHIGKFNRSDFTKTYFLEVVLSFSTEINSDFFCCAHCARESGFEKAIIDHSYIDDEDNEEASGLRIS